MLSQNYQVLFAVALLFSIANGSPAIENRIYGGQEAELGQFPHMVSLRYLHKHLCGASILSNRFVLTAAHCCPRRNNTVDFYITINYKHERSLHKILGFAQHEAREFTA